MSEENTTQPPVEVEEEKDTKKGVSKTEFTKFQKEVTGVLGTITDTMGQLMEKVNTITQTPQQPAPAQVVEGGTDSESLVPPAWRKLTDEILGPDFQISLRLPENGGQIFEIMVPREKSNATQDHWEMHKRDKRSRELGNTGIEGVKSYLLKVRRNLASSGIKLPYYENSEAPLISTR